MLKFSTLALGGACALLAPSQAQAQTIQPLPLIGTPMTSPLMAPINSSFGFEGIPEVVMPDLDNNGVSEIAVAYYDAALGGVLLEVFYNGAMTGTPFLVNTAPLGPASLDAGDIDGDGLTDLVVALQANGATPVQVIVFLNNGGIVVPVGPIPATGFLIGERVHDVEVADITVDGVFSEIVMAATGPAGDSLHVLSYAAGALTPVVLPIPAVPGPIGPPSSFLSNARARITIGDIDATQIPGITWRTGPTGNASAGIQMVTNFGGGLFGPITPFFGAPFDAITDLQSANFDAVVAGDMVFSDPLFGVHAFQTGLPATGLITQPVPTSLALNAAGFTGVPGATTDIVTAPLMRLLPPVAGQIEDAFSCDALGRITAFLNDQAPAPPVGATFNTQLGTTFFLVIPGAPYLNSIAAGYLEDNAFTDFATCSRAGGLWRILN